MGHPDDLTRANFGLIEAYMECWAKKAIGMQISATCQSGC